jgi:hypothetical protein
MVATMAPQGQAERLLQYAISRHVGATDAIKTRVTDWRAAQWRSWYAASGIETTERFRRFETEGDRVR